MKRTLIAALIALFALGSGGTFALASHDDADLKGTIGDVSLAEEEGDLIGSFTLTLDDNGADPDELEVEIDEDTSLDLDCFDQESDLSELNQDELEAYLEDLEDYLDGKHAAVSGVDDDEANDDNEDNEANDDEDLEVLADSVTVLGEECEGENDGDGAGMSAAAHYKNAHVAPGPGRGAFMRCVHANGGEEAGTFDSAEELFEYCAEQANSGNFRNGHGHHGDHDDEDDGEGHGNGNGHDKDKDKDKGNKNGNGHGHGGN